MKLHWSPKSPYVRKVMICAQELCLADRMELIRSVAAMLKPNERLMQDNPLSKIPTLVLEDGFTLFDSVVICEYLDDLGGGSLFPRAGSDKWQALRWHALGDNMLDNLILWRGELMRPKPQQSPEILAAFDAKIRASLDALENEAAALGAASVGIGHVAIGVALGYIDFRFPDLGWRNRHPKITAWNETFAQRPSIRNTMPVDA